MDLPNITQGEASQPIRNKNRISRQNAQQQSEKNKQLDDNKTPTTKREAYIRVDNISFVNKENKQHLQSPSHQIPPSKGGCRPYPENKQTPKQEKMVTNKPTVAADDLRQKITNGHSNPNRYVSLITKAKRPYNNTTTFDNNAHCT
jgi:hypothetical protein